MPETKPMGRRWVDGRGWPHIAGFFRFTEAVDKFNREDLGLLESWERHFEDKGITTRRVGNSKRHYLIALYREGVEAGDADHLEAFED